MSSIQSIENKLAEYRSRRNRVTAEPSLTMKKSTSESCTEEEPLVNRTDSISDSGDEEEDTSGILTSWCKSVVDKYGDKLALAEVVIKVVLWFTLLIIAIKVQFAAIFIIFTIFYLIWKNLRTEKKEIGEMSAYSVFNPNCESIQGTLTAEQLQQEMMLGPLGGI